MKLSEVIDYKDRPVIELSKLAPGFDEDLLIDMVKEHEANIFIDGGDLSDVLADGIDRIANTHLAASEHAASIPQGGSSDNKSYTYNDLVGGFTMLAYSPTQHALFCQYDAELYYAYRRKLTGELKSVNETIDGQAKITVDDSNRPWLKAELNISWPNEKLIELTKVCRLLPDYERYMK